MDKKLTNISLSFQCNENWQEMSEEGTGRHCEKCQCKVHDFRNSSDKEYRRVMKESNNKVCGLFKASQISSSYLHYATAATMLAIATLPVACSPEITEPIKPQIKIEHIELLGAVFAVDDSTEMFSLPTAEPETIDEFELGIVSDSIRTTDTTASAPE